MFSIRTFQKDDYPMYISWLSARNRPAPRFVDLPDLGVVVKDDREAAIGFLIESDSAVCGMGNFASNPDHKLRSDAVDFLIDSLVGLAKEKGYQRLFVNTNRGRLIARLKDKGFTVYDEHLTQLGADLCH